VEQVLWASRERVQDLKQDRRFRYIIVFKNHGAAAGASLEPLRSQLIALPIVPREVRDEMDGARAHYRARSAASSATDPRRRAAIRDALIAENGDMVAIAPLRPRFPFETWILPKRHQSLFEDAPRHEYASLARLLRDILRA
jgi:UDPglucose--hexose-1-phosphate uridylyltransferase